MSASRFELEATLRSPDRVDSDEEDNYGSDGHRSRWPNGFLSVAAVDEHTVVAACNDRTLKVFDRNLGASQILLGHTGGVTCVVALPGPGRKIVSGSSDGTLKIWDLRVDREGLIHTLAGGNGRVSCVDVLPDGMLVSAASGHIKIWDPISGQFLQELRHPPIWEIEVLAVAPDGRILTGPTGYDYSDDEDDEEDQGDHTVTVWNRATPDSVETLVGHRAPVNAIAALPAGRAVSGDGLSELIVWALPTDLSEARLLQTIDYDTSFYCAAVLSGSLLVTGSGEEKIHFWDLDKGRCLQELHGHSDFVLDVVVIPGGRVASASRDGTIKIWADPQRDQEMRLTREVCRQRACCDLFCVMKEFL